MSSQASSRFAKGFGFALLAVVLWSGNFIAARALHHRIPPVSLAFFRWVIATLVIFPFAARQIKADWNVVRTHLLYLSLTALTGVSIFNTFIYIAGESTTAINLALIGTTASPVFVLLISGIVLRDKLPFVQYLGALLCILGIFLLLSKGSFTQLQHFRFSAGDLWILSAALSFAVYTLLVKRKPADISATSFLFVIFFFGTLFLLPAFIVTSRSTIPIDWTPPLIFTLLYLGIGASVISFLAWNFSVKQIGPSRTALFGNLIPVFSTLEAALILGERITAVTVLSFAVILTGIGLANAGILASLFSRPPAVQETKDGSGKVL